MATFQK